MRLRRYCRRVRNSNGGAEDIELNLVPMLDMFLSLIPFLLVSAAFLNYGGLLIETPSLSSAEEANEVKRVDEHNLNLAVQVSDSRVTISAYSQGFLSKIEKLTGDFDLTDSSALAQYLGNLKKEYQIKSVLFHVDSAVRYQKAVGVLQALRKSDLSQHIVLAVKTLPVAERAAENIQKEKAL